MGNIKNKSNLCFSITAGNVGKLFVVNVAKDGAPCRSWDLNTMSEFVILAWKPSAMKSEWKNMNLYFSRLALFVAFPQVYQQCMHG